MRGLLNPKNFVESSGSAFKEGLIRVDTSVFKVHQNKVREGQPPAQPILALVWGVTRLDEDNHEPLHDDDGNEQKEELVFSFGGKSLAQAHPGGADGPDDEEASDLGVDVGTEGPSVFLVNPQFKLNNKSGLSMLMGEESLKKAGFKEEYLDRVWAPDFVNSIFHMKSFVSKETMKDEKGQDRPISYKVVDRIIRAGYEFKKAAGEKKAATASGSTKGGDASANGKGNPEAEAVVSRILTSLSETLDGQKLTKKALSTRVSGVMQSEGVASKLHVPVLELVKSPAWLKKNGGTFDLVFNEEEGTVVFGTLAE